MSVAAVHREKKNMRLEAMKVAGRRRHSGQSQVKAKAHSGRARRKIAAYRASIAAVSPLNSEYMPFTWMGHVVTIEGEHIVARLQDQEKPGLHKMVKFARSRIAADEQKLLEPGIALSWKFKISKVKKQIQPQSLQIKLHKTGPLTADQLKEVTLKAKEVTDSIQLE